MERPTTLLEVLVSEILIQHSLPADDDVRVIVRRFESEGIGFITLALPALGAAFEAALEEGRFQSTDCVGFAHHRRGTLPKFLKGLFQRIFHLDGQLRTDADPEAIWGIRQICNFVKKPKISCSPRREAKAVAKYVAVEKELSSFEFGHLYGDRTWTQLTSLLWDKMFSGIHSEDIVCKHGPGSTADGVSANSRFKIRSWPERSQTCFPMDLHVIPHWGDHAALMDVDLLSVEEEHPVKVVFVPKTLKTPRVIAMEPHCMQYMQQGLLRLVLKRISSDLVVSESVRFNDQSVNRDLARQSSITRDRATLDLSDASDRVHNDLVRAMLRNTELLPFLDACRSRRALLPGEDVPRNLNKFASMGSAMCFPIEAMVFYTVVLYAHHIYHQRRPSRESIAHYSSRIDVYGDDIIVPRYIAGTVIEQLEAFGLRVNRNKTFRQSHFRESCGGDFYKGVDVKPTYLRVLLPGLGGHLDPKTLVSLVKTADQLYQAGLWTTCQWLREFIQKTWRVSIPRCPYQGPGLKFLSFGFTTKLTWRSTLHAFGQVRMHLLATKQDDAVPEDALTMRYFLGDSSEAPLDYDRSVKRGVLKTKRRWTPALIGRAEIGA